jgi:hypothetical protein
MPQEKVNYPLNVHNTYWPSYDDAVSQDRAGRSKVHPFMAQLIEALQVKRPNWEFEASSYGTVNHSGEVNDILHSSFDIYDNGEKLASIDKEFKNNGHVYAVKNHRLVAARERGLWTNRKNLKDITAVILKNVYPHTVAEIADAKYKASHSSAQSASYKARQLHTRAIERLAAPALEFLSSQWNAFMAVPTGNTHADEAKEKFFELRDNAEAAKVFATSPHWVVVERPRDFIVQPVGKEAYACSLESMPDQVKMALGLLKMTEKDTLINDVGVRTDVDTFFILHNPVDVPPEEG